MPWPGDSRQAPTGRRWAGDPTIHSLPIRPCSTPTTGPSALPHLALRHAIIDAIILAADLPDDAVVDVRLTAGEDLGGGRRRPSHRAGQPPRRSSCRPGRLTGHEQIRSPGDGTRSDMLGTGPAVAVRLLTAESRGVSRTRPCARTHS